MMKDTKAWSQKIQKDKSFAKGYKGLTSVKDILKKAKADGYDLKESDITKEDIKALELVAGGLFENGGMPGMGAFQGMGENKPSGGPSASAGQVAVSTTQTTTVHTQKFGTNTSATGQSQVANNFTVQMTQTK